MLGFIGLGLSSRVSRFARREIYYHCTSEQATHQMKRRCHAPKAIESLANAINMVRADPAKFQADNLVCLSTPCV